MKRGLSIAVALLLGVSGGALLSACGSDTKTVSAAEVPPVPSTTTTATQALLLINGDRTLARAQTLAGRIARLEPASINDRGRIALAYRLTCGREAEPDEIEQAAAFLNRQTQLAQPPVPRVNVGADHAALVDFCHALLNSNEFLYVD